MCPTTPTGLTSFLLFSWGFDARFTGCLSDSLGPTASPLLLLSFIHGCVTACAEMFPEPISRQNMHFVNRRKKKKIMNFLLSSLLFSLVLNRHICSVFIFYSSERSEMLGRCDTLTCMWSCFFGVQPGKITAYWIRLKTGHRRRLLCAKRHLTWQETGNITNTIHTGIE